MSKLVSLTRGARRVVWLGLGIGVGLAFVAGNAFAEPIPPDIFDGIKPSPGPLAPAVPMILSLVGAVYWVGIVVVVAGLLVGIARMRSARQRGLSFAEDDNNAGFLNGIVRFGLLLMVPNVLVWLAGFVGG